MCGRSRKCRRAWLGGRGGLRERLCGENLLLLLCRPQRGLLLHAASKASHGAGATPVRVGCRCILQRMLRSNPLPCPPFRPVRPCSDFGGVDLDRLPVEVPGATHAFVASLKELWQKRSVGGAEGRHGGEGRRPRKRRRPGWRDDE